MVFSTAQEAPAGWTFASKYICLFFFYFLTFHNIVAPRLLQLGIEFKKKYAGLEFRSTFVFISLNWFLQTCGFYEWNKHCEWSFTLGILVHPIEHNCKDSSVTFVSRCWQGDDSDKLNWYWSRSCCIQQDCSVGNDAMLVSTWSAYVCTLTLPITLKLFKKCISFIASIGQFRPKKMCVYGPPTDPKIRPDP